MFCLFNCSEADEILQSHDTECLTSNYANEAYAESDKTDVESNEAPVQVQQNSAEPRDAEPPFAASSDWSNLKFPPYAR